MAWCSQVLRVGLYIARYPFTIYVLSFVLRMGMSGKRARDHEDEGYRVMADQSLCDEDACSLSCGVGRRSGGMAENRHSRGQRVHVPYSCVYRVPSVVMKPLNSFVR